MTNLELQALSSAEEYTKEYLTVTESIKIYIKSAKESKEAHHRYSGISQCL